MVDEVRDGVELKHLDAELFDGHKRDLRTQLRRLGQSEDWIVLAQLAIACQRPASLTHEPHGCGVDGLMAAGGAQPLGAGHG